MADSQTEVYVSTEMNGRDLVRRIMQLPWWLVMLRGVALAGMGICAISQPAETFMIVVYIVAIFAIVDGLFLLIGGAMGLTEKGKHWPILLRGALGVLIGGFVLSHWVGASILAAYLLVYFVGFQALGAGVFEIITGVKMRKTLRGGWWLISSGVVLILIGGILIFQPQISAQAVILALGVLAILGGVLLILLSSKLRQLQKVKS